MNVLTITRAPSASIAAALDRFERDFQYPLGTHDTFRVCHGADYSRFFRAMGKGVSFAVEHNGSILGTLGMALRKVRQPNATEITVVYIGDLKVSSAVRGTGVVPLALFQAGLTWAWQNGASKAYGVVMDGTAKTPSDYTGRIGIPKFLEVGKIVVLRIPTDLANNGIGETGSSTSAARLESTYKRLTASVHAPIGGRPSLRSSFAPVRLVSADGQACGLLEDTLQAKRLISSNGDELLSAHLSRFAFGQSRADSAVELLETALRLAAARGFPAMFVALDKETARALLPHIERFNPVEAPATIYGFGFTPGQKLLINTAEI
jgi:hypothetical protein